MSNNPVKPFLLLCFLPSFLVAQHKVRAFEFGGGSSYYFGDLSPIENMGHGFFTTPSFQVHVGYTQVHSSRLESIIDFTVLRIIGDDFAYARGNFPAYREQLLRNLHFRNDIKELTWRARYSFTPNEVQSHFDRPRFNGYATLGLGIIGHNPEARLPAGIDKNRNWVYLRDKFTSGQDIFEKTYSLVQVVVPFGVGMRYKLTRHWDVNVEAVLRISSTDYLDDVSNSKYLPANLFNSEEAYALHNRSLESAASRTGESRIAAIQSVFGKNQEWQKLVEQNLGKDRGFNSLLKRNDSYCLVSLSFLYWLGQDIK